MTAVATEVRAEWWEELVAEGLPDVIPHNLGITSEKVWWALSREERNARLASAFIAAVAGGLQLHYARPYLEGPLAQTDSLMLFLHSTLCRRDLLPYDLYLSSPAWQAIRNRALERDGHRCRLCNSRDHLNVHHRTYDRRGYERLDDLTTLCHDCHAKFHGKHG